jgi:hypothetical protein
VYTFPGAKAAVSNFVAQLGEDPPASVVA